MTTRLTSLFPIWALIAVIVAILAPEPLTPLKPAIVPLLGLVMFGMGMTLTWQNFADVLRRPGIVLLGTVLQFLIMPMAAWLVALILGLPPMLAAGLILVGSCPGGTASNVVTYLARGDVALSITLTTVTTLLAIFATPILTWLYAGTRVHVPADLMIATIAEIVLLPVFAGLLTNQFLGKRLGAVKQIFPLISVLAIVIIIAIVVALNHANIGVIGPAVILAVILHNSIGLITGYWVPRLLGKDARTCRTLAIEVGMQNSGLGVALAMKYFSASAALPGALFSIWHNLSGSVLASWWRSRSISGKD